MMPDLAGDGLPSTARRSLSHIETIDDSAEE
jgi:hypothetical protein